MHHLSLSVSLGRAMNFVILVGMMGSGKSTVGRLLAEDLGVPFWDTDNLLAHRLGRPVSQLFSLYGEDAFRQHETNLLRSIESTEGVLATGGGIVIKPDNWVEMRRLGTTVFLDVEPDIVKKRLANSKRKRPLLQVKDWEDRFHAILDARRELYLQADIHVQITADEFPAVVAKIKESLATP